MPRTVEVAHYSELIASLMVSVARPAGPADAERLSLIRGELSKALTDIFALISHDAGALGFAIELDGKKQHDGVAV